MPAAERIRDRNVGKSYECFGARGDGPPDLARAIIGAYASREYSTDAKLSKRGQI
jgi:hypothetical protein